MPTEKSPEAQSVDGNERVLAITNIALTGCDTKSRSLADGTAACRSPVAACELVLDGTSCAAGIPNPMATVKTPTHMSVALQLLLMSPPRPLDA